MRYLLCISLALALLAGSDLTMLAAMGSAAAAENPPNDDRCTEQGKPFSIDSRIDACTAMIDSGQYKGKDLAWILVNRGNAWNAKHDLDRAISDYSEAIRADPKSSSAYNNRGSAYNLKRDYDRAISDYTEAISLAPDFAIAYNGRCLAHNNKGEADLALPDCNQAIALEPKDVLAYNNRGNAWRAKNELDRAIADYSEAIRIEPKYVTAYNNRGDAYGMKMDYEHAIADFSESIRLDPGNAEVFNARCWTRAIAGRELQQALADCGESLRLRPNEANTHDSLAFTHLKLGDLDRALAEYNTALGLNSRLPGSLYGRGIVELRKGDATAAEMDIQAAKAIQAGIADEFAKYGIAP